MLGPSASFFKVPELDRELPVKTLEIGCLFDQPGFYELPLNKFISRVRKFFFGDKPERYSADLLSMPSTWREEAINS